MKPITKRAFTLIELLVVIVVIALLMTILLPALGRARLQAKKARVASQISGISVALHAFANDNGDFPSSDPFRGYPPPPVANDPNYIPYYAPTGAHLLGLALVGRPDGLFLSGNNITYKGKSYMGVDQGKAVPDTNATLPGRVFPVQPAGGGQLGGYGCFILRDVSFDYPILYYKANRAARFLADTNQYNCAGLARGSATPAVYYLSDNAIITGTDTAFTDPAYGTLGPFLGWDLGKGLHPAFKGLPGHPYQGVNKLALFSDYVEVENTRYGGDISLARAQNSEEFLLISAGPDGVFGPTGPGPDACDDIGNFTVPRSGPS